MRFLNYIFILITTMLIFTSTGYSQINIIDAPPCIAKNLSSPELASAADRALAAISEKAGSPISLDSILGLSNYTSVDDFRPSRAVASGYPRKCGGSWHSWGRATPRQAAISALRGCIKAREGIESHTKNNGCGCRLVLIDNVVLGPARSINYRRRRPITAFIRNPEIDKTAIIKGMVSSAGLGERLPLAVFDDQGREMCSGTYSLTKLNILLGGGEFSLNCFGSPYVIAGQMRSKKIPNPRGKGKIYLTIATADLEGGERMALISGLPSKALTELPGIVTDVFR